jgi:transcription elongation factor GreA-like protein
MLICFHRCNEVVKYAEGEGEVRVYLKQNSNETIFNHYIRIVHDFIDEFINTNQSCSLYEETTVTIL